MTTAHSNSRRGLGNVLDSPRLELAVGLILLAAGIVEIRNVILVAMPNRGPMLPHAAATLGAALVLRSLPGMFLGLELADRAFQGLTPRPALAFLDRLAHSHAADLAMGVILLAAGAADLADILAVSGGLPRLSALFGLPGAGAASGAVVFGLGPVAEALLAMFLGARRLDRERPSPFLDRAVRFPAIRAAAGLALLGGGAWELWAGWGDALGRIHGQMQAQAGHGPALAGGLALLGLFGLVSGLPGLFLGLKTLAGLGRPPS